MREAWSWETLMASVRQESAGDGVSNLERYRAAGKEGVHESRSGVTRVALLVETDDGVDEEKGGDTDEILPVRRTVLAVGRSDGDKSGRHHDPG